MQCGDAATCDPGDTKTITGHQVLCVGFEEICGP
jgi:hypothetical protein